jgi:hypothetical protein
MYFLIKYLGLALVMLMGLYPIVELTRVIIVNGQYYFPEMSAQFNAEVAIMWVLYLGIIPVYLIVSNYILRVPSKTKKEALKPVKDRRPSLLLEEKADYIKVDYRS